MRNDDRSVPDTATGWAGTHPRTTEDVPRRAPFVKIASAILSNFFRSRVFNDPRVATLERDLGSLLDRENGPSRSTGSTGDHTDETRS